MPTLMKLWNKSNTGKIINEFQKDTGSKDYGTLLKILNKFEQGMRCVKNYEELNKIFYTVMNMVFPSTCRSASIYFFLHLPELFEIDVNKIPEFIDADYELKELSEQNPEIYEYYTQSQENKLRTTMSQDKQNKFIKEYEELNENQIERLISKSLITDTNVHFYHGTSFEKYLKILKDGFIKATDYSKVTFPNKNMENVYKTETGYVFVKDLLDTPLTYGFNTYKNALPWDWKRKDKSDITNKIMVIFEIDPTNYELYFRNKENDFIIKGNVSLDDVNNILFFKWDKETSYITQISEEEARKEGILNGLLHE